MSYPVQAPYFTSQAVTVKPRGLLSGAKLMQNNQPAPKGEKRGTFLLTQDDGTQVTASLKHSNFLDPVPQVIIGEEAYTLAEPMAWYFWVWAVLPFGLVFMGGLLGGLAGGLGATVNAGLVRREMSGLLKFLAMGAVSLTAVVVYLVLALIVSALISG